MITADLNAKAGQQKEERKNSNILPEVTQFPAIELLKRISPKLPTRTGFAMIFSYLWEFN